MFLILYMKNLLLTAGLPQLHRESDYVVDYQAEYCGLRVQR